MVFPAFGAFLAPYGAKNAYMRAVPASQFSSPLYYSQ